MPRLPPPPPPNVVDRVVNFLAPRAGLARMRARHAMALDSYFATKKSRHNRQRDNRGGTGDDHLNDRSLWELREISYDLDRNNGLSIGVIDRSVENILGANGFNLQAGTKDSGLNATLEEDWNDWLEFDCDDRGEFHGWQIFKQMYRAELIGGDDFCQMDPQGRRGNGSLISFEGNRVLNPSDADAINEFELVNGVARDGRGRPRFYFVTKGTPQDGFARVADGMAVPADQVAHLYNPRRKTQTRGCPIMSPVIREFDDIDDLLMYERVGAKLVAAQGYFIQTDDPLSMADMLRDPDASSDERIEEILPGSVNYLKKGETPVSVQSNRPSNNFVPFVQLLNRYVGLPLGLPLELVLLDFSNVNFASSRQLLYIAQLHFREEQFDFGCWLSRIYRWWVMLRVSRGHYKNRPDILRHIWGTPGWPSPNPVQDASANKINVEIGVDSRRQIIQRRGDDPDQIKSDLDMERTEAQQNQPAAVDPANPDQPQPGNAPPAKQPPEAK